MEEEESDLELERLREHGRALRQAAGGLADASQNALADTERIASEAVRSHPYTALGAAFAAGWILAGGIPVGLLGLAGSPLGRAALGLAAVRLAGRPGEGAEEGHSDRHPTARRRHDA